MTIAIVDADFDDPRLSAFLQAHLDDLAPTAPAESRHALDLDGLRRNGTWLWVADDGDRIVGTVAVMRLDAAHFELKSMRTAPDLRRRGVGRALLDRAVEHVRQQGGSRVSLETGSMEFFAAARALYRGSGFEPCEPFGAYRADPNSVFMTRPVTAPVRRA